MSTLDHFIEALAHDQDKLIKIRIIKEPNAHELDVHEINNACNQNAKQKSKGKAHAKPNKEGHSKPFDDSSSSKGGKGKKGTTKYGYWNCDYHPEYTCMKK